MVKKIIYAFSLTVVLASAGSTIVLSIVNSLILEGKIFEIFFYFFAGLALSLFFLPVLGTLLVVASNNNDLDLDDLMEELNKAHVLSLFLTFIFGNIFFYFIMGGSSNFIGVQFGISFILLVLYGIFAYFGWRIAFREK